VGWSISQNAVINKRENNKGQSNKNGKVFLYHFPDDSTVL